MKLHHKSKRTLHFQKGDVCPFCDAAEESLKHSYSDYPVDGMCLFRGMPAVRSTVCWKLYTGFCRHNRTKFITHTKDIYHVWDHDFYDGEEKQMFQVTVVFDSHEDDFWPSYIGRQCRELIHLRDCLAFHAEEVNRIAKTAASPITLCNPTPDKPGSCNTPVCLWPLWNHQKLSKASNRESTSAGGAFPLNNKKEAVMKNGTS